PAQILAHDGAHVLRNALRNSAPLSNTVLADQLGQPNRTDGMRDAVAALAAASPDTWDAGSARIAQATDTPLPAVRRHLARARDRRSPDDAAASRAGLRPDHQPAEAAARPAEKTGNRRPHHHARPTGQVAAVERGRSR